MGLISEGMLGTKKSGGKVKETAIIGNVITFR
jgi:hypothetical protein